MVRFKDIKDSLIPNDGELGKIFSSISGGTRRMIITNLGKLNYVQKYEENITFLSLAKIIYWLCYASRMAERKKMRTFEQLAFFIQFSFTDFYHVDELSGSERVGKDRVIVSEAHKNEKYKEIILALRDALKNPNSVRRITINSDSSMLVEDNNSDFKSFAPPAKFKPTKEALTSFSFNSELLEHFVSIVDPKEPRQQFAD